MTRGVPCPAGGIGGGRRFVECGRCAGRSYRGVGPEGYPCAGVHGPAHAHGGPGGGRAGRAYRAARVCVHLPGVRAFTGVVGGAGGVGSEGSGGRVVGFLRYSQIYEWIPARRSPVCGQVIRVGVITPPVLLRGSVAGLLQVRFRAEKKARSMVYVAAARPRP